MSTKCNYSYDKIKLVALAMEARLITNKTKTVKEAKSALQEIYALLQILATDKKLTEELAEEGKQAYAK